MIDQPKPQSTPAVSPQHLVFDRPVTAQDLFTIACRNDLGCLTGAAMTKPGESYTLNINLALRFSRDDVMLMLTAGGFDVTFPTEVKS